MASTSNLRRARYSGSPRKARRPCETKEGRVASEGDPAQNADPKWTYRDGANRLGKLLAEGLDIRREVRIGRVRQRGPRAERYELFDSADRHIGDADALLFTAPAPQTAEILAASALDGRVGDAALAELGRV